MPREAVLRLVTRRLETVRSDALQQASLFWSRAQVQTVNPDRAWQEILARRHFDDIEVLSSFIYSFHVQAFLLSAQTNG